MTKKRPTTDDEARESRPADEPDDDAPRHVQASVGYQEHVRETAGSEAALTSPTSHAKGAAVTDDDAASALLVLRRYLVENGHGDPLAVGKARHDLRHPGTGQFTPAPGRPAAHPYLTDGRAADSPANAPVTPRPDTAWPGADTLATGPLAHALSAHGATVHQVYPPAAPRPEAQATVQAAQNPDHPEAAWPHGPLTVAVQHLDLTGQRAALGVGTSPVQPPPRTAPTGATTPQPRGGGFAAPHPPGA